MRTKTRGVRISSESAEQTRALGRKLGRLLRGRDLVCLIGDLGSGKTTFTQGLARGLGFRGQVSSPTFVLARVYRGKSLAMYHLDFFRLSPDETRDVGLEDYLADRKGVCVVEWPEAVRGYFPADRLEVRLSYGRREDVRRLAFKASGPRSRALLGRTR